MIKCLNTKDLLRLLRFRTAHLRQLREDDRPYKFESFIHKEYVDKFVIVKNQIYKIEYELRFRNTFKLTKF